MNRMIIDHIFLSDVFTGLHPTAASAPLLLLAPAERRGTRGVHRPAEVGHVSSAPTKRCGGVTGCYSFEFCFHSKEVTAVWKSNGNTLGYHPHGVGPLW